MDPEFVARVGTCRPKLEEDGTYAGGSYLASKEAKRVEVKVGSNQLFRDGRSHTLELCYDNFEPWDSCSHSMGVLGVRCTDLPEDVKNRSRFCHVVALFPGPKMTKNIRLKHKQHVIHCIIIPVLYVVLPVICCTAAL